MYNNQIPVARGITDDLIGSVTTLSEQGIPINIALDGPSLAYLGISLFVTFLLLIISYLALKKVI